MTARAESQVAGRERSKIDHFGFQLGKPFECSLSDSFTVRPTPILSLSLSLPSPFYHLSPCTSGRRRHCVELVAERTARSAATSSRTGPTSRARGTVRSRRYRGGLDVIRAPGLFLLLLSYPTVPLALASVHPHRQSYPDHLRSAHGDGGDAFTPASPSAIVPTLCPVLCPVTGHRHDGRTRRS